MIKAGIKTMLLVRDIMTEGVVFLRSSQSLDDAFEALRARGIRGAPVLTDRGRLVGVVSASDLADPRHRGRTVEEAMTRLVFAVRADDPVMTAVRLMVGEDIHRAVVVNEDGTLAGIIAPMDILRALTQGQTLGDASQQDPPIEFVDLRKIAE